MSGLTDILRAVAPTIATALGGPLAGAAVSFLASKLGVDPAVVEQTVAGMGPADLVKLKQMDLDFQLEMQRIVLSVPLAQIGVNTEEAKSGDWWVAGGRPACIWIGALSLFYESFLEPLMRFISVVMFHYKGTFPLIDTTLTMQVLFGLLGISGLRSLDKYNGTDTKRIKKS